MKKLIVVSFIFILFQYKGQQDYKIDSVFNSFLSSNVLSNAHVGVQLFDVSSNKSLINYNSKKLFVPASIQKLLTTATAFEILPSNFSFKTTVLISGELDSLSGIINGNLLLQCSGDPSLESVYFENKSFITELINALKTKKIKGFTGGLILIDYELDNYQVNSNWLWGDIGNYYGSGVSNFSFRDNTIELFFNSSTSIGELTTISKVNPENINVDIENNVVSGKTFKDLAYGFGGPYNSKRIINGEIPAGKKDFKVKISMHNPADYLINELNQLIQFENNTFKGALLDTLLVYNSPSILELVTHVNHKSNNNYTEHILFESFKIKDSVQNVELAALKMNEYWGGKLSLDERFFSVDGCGLSRKNE